MAASLRHEERVIDDVPPPSPMVSVDTLQDAAQKLSPFTAQAIQSVEIAEARLAAQAEVPLLWALTSPDVRRLANLPEEQREWVLRYFEMTS